MAGFGVCISKESHLVILWNRAHLQPLPLALSVPSLEVMHFVQVMWPLAECYIPMEKLPEYSVTGRLPVASPWGNAWLMASVCTEIKARQLQVLLSGDSEQLLISQRKSNPEQILRIWLLKCCTCEMEIGSVHGNGETLHPKVSVSPFLWLCKHFNPLNHGLNLSFHQALTSFWPVSLPMDVGIY